MTFVVDSSVALSWCFPDEFTTQSDASYAAASISTLFVPRLWHIEMANVLGLALRRGRISSAALDEALKTLDALDVQTRPIPDESDVRVFTTSMNLYALTAYDASYLMLAQQLQLPIATFDRALAAAGRRAGLEVLTFQANA